jgi:hypothetical protein
MRPISVTLLLKGSPKRLPQVLNSLKSFEEVLVYENGAEENALAELRNHQNVNLKTGPFLGFGPTHNLASSLAKYPWIFSVDSDEVVSTDLRNEIESLPNDSSLAYSMPRHNQYNNKTIYGCGWHPDRVLRLYHRDHARFSEALVHEKIELHQAKEVALKAPLFHYSYESLSDFLQKMQIYSDLFASQNAGKVSSSPLTAVLHASAAFFKSYFLKRGFLDGYEGHLISMYNAHTAFYKYLKLYEANLRLNDSKTRRCPEEKGS